MFGGLLTRLLAGLLTRLLTRLLAGLLTRLLAGLLARTPYVLLLSIVGINVVSAAEFAGEMGPIERYPKARAISGRAWLFPARPVMARALGSRPIGPISPANSAAETTLIPGKLNSST